MLLKLIYQPNTSLVNLSSDVTGALTGAITNVADLKCADKNKSVIINTLPSTWVLCSEKTGVVNQKVYSVADEDGTVSYMSLQYASNSITVGIYEYWDSIRSYGVNPVLFPAYIVLDLVKGGEIRIHSTKEYCVIASVLNNVWSSGQGAVMALTRKRSEGWDKFDSAIKWAAGVGGATESYDDVIVDGGGRVYVAGYSSSSEMQGGGADGLLVCYNVYGEIIYQRFIGTDTSNDRLTSVSDARDGVIAVGYATLAANADGMIVKYSSSGVLEWSNIFGDTAGSQQFCGVACIKAQTPDQDKYVAVGNDSVATKGGIVIAFSNTGTILWQKNIVGCTIAGVCSDGAYIYVSGYTTTASLGAEDLLVFKLNVNSGGVEKKVQIGGAGSDTAKGIAVSKEKNAVYVAGSTDSTGTVGGSDMLLVKLDSATFALSWAVACGYATTDIGNAVAVGTGGWIYLCGQCNGGAVVSVYDDTEASLWQREIKEHAAGSITGPFSIATDNPTEGKCFITCRSSAGPMVVKLDNDAGANNIANMITVSKSVANVSPIALKSIIPSISPVDVSPPYTAQQKKPTDKTPGLLSERNWPLVGHSPIITLVTVGGISTNISSPRLSGATGAYIRGGEAYFLTSTAFGSNVPPAVNQRDESGNLLMSMCDIGLTSTSGAVSQASMVRGKVYLGTSGYMSNGDTIYLTRGDTVEEYTVYAGGANRVVVFNG